MHVFLGSRGLAALSAWLDELPRRPLYARIIAEEGDRHEFVPMRDDEAVVVNGPSWERRPS